VVKFFTVFLLFTVFIVSSIGASEDLPKTGQFALNFLPDPEVMPDNDKYPDYKTEDNQARERSKDYCTRYIQEYFRIWTASEIGRNNPFDIQQVISNTIDVISKTDRMDNVRNLYTGRIKSVLDSMAIKALRKSPLEVRVYIDPQLFPSAEVNWKQARARAQAYIQAAVDSAEAEWKLTRNSPYALPGLELAKAKALKAVLWNSDLKSLNSQNPGKILDLIAEVTRDADRFGARDMAMIILNRLEKYGLSNSEGIKSEVAKLATELQNLQTVADGGRGTAPDLKVLDGELKALQIRLRGLTWHFLIVLAAIAAITVFLFPKEKSKAGF
jgi:hypothetical protein